MAKNARAPRYSAPRPSRRERRAQRRADGRGNIFWRWRRFLFVCGLLGVAGVATAGYAFTQVSLPSSEPPLLETTFICAADVVTGCTAANSIAQLSSGQNRVTVTYDQLPAQLVDAVVAIEDDDFFSHSGVDPMGIVRAVWSNLRSDDGSTQGGSTITQQYVKNTYLTAEQTFTRKLREAALAVKVERELSKEEILTRYLNVIYLGRGAYGVQAAAQAYFGKDVGDLELHQAAYLAGIIRAPELIDAHLPPEDERAASQRARAEVRRSQVLDAMLEEGSITSAEHAAASAAPFDDVLVRTQAGNHGNVARPDLGTEYFLDHVIRWLVDSGTATEAELYGGGLRIYTTLDLDLQAAAMDAVTSTLDREGDPAASLVAIDDQGGIPAMVGGTDYRSSQVNLATGTEGGGSGRQPGSSFKAFVLAAALADGVPLDTRYESPGTKTFKGADNGADWKVGNYADAGQGNLDLVEATKVSSNTAYAQLIMDIGPERVVELATQMGVSSPLDPDLSLALGTPSVSVLDMASGFSTLAARGERLPVHAVTRVTDSKGTVLWEVPAQGERVLEEDVADQVNWTLSQVIEDGTGTRAKIDQPAAGKTGTTDDYGNAWFAGYTCSLTAAVWVGHPEGSSHLMTDVHGIKVTGGSFPAVIWQKFMSVATADRLACEFERPRGVSSSTVPRNDSGRSGTTTTTEPSSSTTTEPSSPSTSTAPTSSTTAPTTSSTTVPPTTSTTEAPPPTTDPPPSSVPPP